MTTKYGILNPATGEYIYVDNEIEISDKMSNIAMQFYLQYTHNTPVSKVTAFEDGSETWEAYRL
jgi:hypothetical protein